MRNSIEQNFSDELAHLERLFLTAQFLSRDTNEAARLVEAVYESLAGRDSDDPGDASFADLVEILMAAAASGEYMDIDDVRPLTERIGRTATDQFVEARVKPYFLSLTPAERMALWACVEADNEPDGTSIQEEDFPSGKEAVDSEVPSPPDAFETADTEVPSPPEAVETVDWEEPSLSVSIEPDALDQFCTALSDSASPVELNVYSPYLDRATTARALRAFWDTEFVPVPPTLRSVLESKVLRGRKRWQRKENSNRPVQPDNGKHKKRSRVVLYTLLILLASLIGYFASNPSVPDVLSTDLLELSRSALKGSDIDFPTSSPEQAERFVFDRFGWRLTVPSISDATLVGVGLRRISESAEIPVFIFSNTVTQSNFSVATYTYAFLQLHVDQFSLPSSTLRQIQEESGFEIHETGDETIVIWRQQDDIFAAFVEEDGSVFRSRITE